MYEIKELPENIIALQNEVMLIKTKANLQVDKHVKIELSPILKIIKDAKEFGVYEYSNDSIFEITSSLTSRNELDVVLKPNQEYLVAVIPEGKLFNTYQLLSGMSSLSRMGLIPCSGERILKPCMQILCGSSIGLSGVIKKFPEFKALEAYFDPIKELEFGGFSGGNVCSKCLPPKLCEWQMPPFQICIPPKSFNNMPAGWDSISHNNEPAMRYQHSAIWTGTEMIVWGGRTNNIWFNDGGIYNPNLNTWNLVNTNNAPSSRALHTTIWTGDKMIVWGGMNYSIQSVNDGAIYDPVLNSWTAMDTTNGPSARYNHTSIWTGDKMIVWGGVFNASKVWNDGAIYDPITNSWTKMDTTNGPGATYGHVAVWTGTEMIILGRNFQNNIIEFKSYNPVTNKWTLQNINGAPKNLSLFSTGVWSNSKLIVWCESESTTPFLYDLSTKNWTSGSAANLTPRHLHTAVWTGCEMIVWGGRSFTNQNLGDGGIYNPVTNKWQLIPLTTIPSPRMHNSAIWTGKEMIIWGGQMIPQNESGYIYNYGTCVKISCRKK